MTSPYEPFDSGAHATDSTTSPYSATPPSPPQQAAGTNATASQSTSETSDSLGQTLRAMWATRPPRIPHEQGGNAKIVGVCEGIGARFGIDPVIPRIAFVATTLALGGGLAAYFLAWALMPRYSKASSPVEDLIGRRDGEKSEAGLAIALLLGFLLTSGAWLLPFSENTFFASFSSSALGIILITGLVWLGLYLHRPAPPAGLLAAGQLTRTTTVKAQPNTQSGADMSMFSPVDGYPFPPGRTTPPAWDPLAAAPDTWHLPDPRPVEEPQPRRSVWKTFLVVAFSFLGVITAIALLFAASAGSGVLKNVTSNNDPTIIDGSAFEHNEFVPRSVADLPDSYDFSVANATVDFSHIRDWDQLNHRTEVTINSGIGNITIILPKGISYSLTCNKAVGTSNCRDQDNPDSTFALHIDSGVGNVTIDYPTAETTT